MNKLDLIHANLKTLSAGAANDIRQVELHHRTMAFPPQEIDIERRVLLGRARDRLYEMLNLIDESLAMPLTKEDR